MKAFPRYCSLALLLTLLLVACSTSTVPSPTSAAGFLFTVDTDMQSIKLESPSTVRDAAPLVVPNTASSCTPEELWQGSDLVVKSLIPTFGPHKSFTLRVVFQNVSAVNFVLPMVFTVDNALTKKVTNIVLPIVGSTELGGDGRLQPDESTQELVFSMKHQGRRFSFFVRVTACKETPGDPDLTFSTDGMLTKDFAGDFDEARAVAIDQNGKIVVAGFARVSGNSDFAVARFNSDGTPDTTFSTDGMLTKDFAGSSDGATAVVIDGDGKIVVAGVARVSGNRDFAVVRFNSDGTPDTTFSTDGMLTKDFDGSSDGANAVAIDQNNKIVVAGRASVSGNSDFAVARFLP